MRSSQRNDLIGWLLVGPAVFLFAVFYVYPLAAGVGLAFCEQVGPTIRFVGLANFRALVEEEALRAGVVNTLLYVVLLVPVTVGVSLMIALLAHGFHRVGILVAAAFYLPGLSTGPILALVWRWIFAPDGLVNGLLSVAGVEPVMWLAGIPSAFIAVCVAVVAMNLGGNLILFLVAARNIPTVLFEMAELDGCSGPQRARYVLVPGMMPTVAIATILSTIGMFQIWVVPFMVTGGGPLHSTTSVVLDLYKNAWAYGRMGVASAEGVVLMLAIGIVAFVQARYLRVRQ